MSKIPECPKCKLPKNMCECSIESTTLLKNNKSQKDKPPLIHWHLILPQFVNERGLKIQCDSREDAKRFERSLLAQQANKDVLWIKQIPTFSTCVDSKNKLYITWLERTKK